MGAYHARRATRIGTQHLIEDDELARMTEMKATLPLPAGWRRTATRDPMPDVLAAIRSSRAGR
jgi:hypothetical protein